MMSWEAERPCPWPGNAWAGLRHQGWGWGLTWMLQAQTTAIQGLKSSCSVPRRHAQNASAVLLLRRCCAPGKGCRCGPDLFSQPPRLGSTGPPGWGGAGSSRAAGPGPRECSRPPACGGDAPSPGRFSVDEGLTWSTHNFTSTSVFVDGLLSEPGDETLVMT